MRVGIVGNGEDKFTEQGKIRAFESIMELLGSSDAVLVSGHSPVGGIDLWAEDVAQSYGIPMDLKIPEVHRWDGGYGYKARNLDIAKDSDVVHVIVADKYPEEYKGRRFMPCYHCARWGGEFEEHVKSGGCWTGYQARLSGNEAIWHIIPNY